jgi:hypothetical protein
MNESKINIFKCFIYSITGFDRYRVLLRQSMGKAVGCLILLSLLMSAVIFIPFFTMTYDVSNKALSYITEKLPDFRLSEGRLEVYGEMPIVFEEGDVPVVIDTTPGAEDSILNQYDTVFLITDSKMVIKNYVNRQEYPFSAFDGLDIKKDTLIKAMPIIKAYINIIYIFSAILLAIIFTGAKFISALVVSIIGLIANSSSRTNLTFKSIFKLSMFSMTLPLIICTVIDALMINIPFMPVLFYAGSGIYIFGAVKSIRRELEATGGWNYYGSDTFSNYRKDDNTGNGSNDPGNIYGYRYGRPDRPFPGNSNNNGTGSDNAAGTPTRESGSDNCGSTAEGPGESSSGNEGDESSDGPGPYPAEEQQENNKNDEK